MDADRVRGILPLGELQRLPGTGATLGMAVFGGSLVFVLDLAALLSIEAGRAGSQPKIVVVEAASTLTAFVADRVTDVAVYRDRHLHNGLLKGNGRPRRWIDLDAVFAGQPLRPSKACSISCLASGEMTVSGKRGGPP